MKTEKNKMKTIKLTNKQYDELYKKADSYDDWCFIDEAIDWAEQEGDLKEAKKLKAQRKVWEEIIYKLDQA
jgi:soluble cytochrome b562